MFKVPVLLVVYNRIEETHNIFQVLKTIQPQQLYVAGDGCLKNDQLDRQHVYQTRAVFQPAWPCNLQTKWQEKHLGKERMMKEAMQWFFENEAEGIILVEDTIPSYDFFPYCEELLARYRNDERVYSIGGTYLRNNSRNRHRKRLHRGGDSYFFSAYATCWGFATWRNRWQDFTLSMEQYDSDQFTKSIAPYMRKKKQRFYWTSHFNILKKYNAAFWDDLYNFHIWTHNGLSVTPYLNLVTNEGFKKKDNRRYRRLRRNAYPIMPLSHANEVVQNYKEDRYMFKHIYKKAYLRLFKDWLKKIIGSK